MAGREEEVGRSGADDGGVEPQRTHQVQAVAEREGDALLRGAQQVGRGVAVEVEAVDAGTRAAVAQHMLGAVAEGDHQQAVRPDGDALGQAVHRGVVERLLRDVAAHPRVHDARAVDAEQDAVAGLLGAVVDVYEGVHAREGVGTARVDHAVDHAARAARGGHLARLQHVEREGVVGLVTRVVGDGRAGRDAEALLGPGVGAGLDADGGAGAGQHRVGDAVVVGHEVGAALLGEVPENLLREAAHGGRDVAREAEGDVVAREHHLVDAGEEFGFVAADPGQLRGGEVARRVEQVLQAAFAAEGFECLGADFDGARVAPDDGLAQGVSRAVDADQAVHLVGDADGPDVVERVSRLAQGVEPHADVVPPQVGVLFGPAAVAGLDGHLLRGLVGRGDAGARFNVH